MALTVDGIPVSGSTGANTYARNRYGAYRRRRTKPVNPNSSRQVSVRSSFSAAVNSWATNGATLISNGWPTWAATTPWLNKAGESTHLSGQAAYVRQASFLQDTTGSMSDASFPPAIPAIGSIDISITSLNWDISSTKWILICDVSGPNTWADTDAGSVLQVQMSVPYGPGRSFKPSRFQSAFIADGAFTGTKDPFVPPFALDTAGGQLVWFRFRGYSHTTRQLSEAIVPAPVLTGTQA